MVTAQVKAKAGTGSVFEKHIATLCSVTHAQARWPPVGASCIAVRCGPPVPTAFSGSRRIVTTTRLGESTTMRSRGRGVNDHDIAGRRAPPEVPPPPQAHQYHLARGIAPARSRETSCASTASSTQSRSTAADDCLRPRHTSVRVSSRRERPNSKTAKTMPPDMTRWRM
jgi:hypothetical protein